MIVLPTSVTQAIAAEGIVRAGGTDLMERAHRLGAPERVVDLRDLAGLDTIEWSDETGLSVGAMVRISQLASHPEVVARYPGLAQAAGGLATPAIRAVATVGGNLLQRNRCWYFRNPGFSCFKKGGAGCRAREGDHLFHSVLDRGPCIAPNASTLATAMLAFDALVLVNGELRPLTSLYGDGTDPSNDVQLSPMDVVTGVLVPPPVEGERSAWFRLASRVRAEWPLVETVVRLKVGDGGTVESVAVALGGVANVPVRAVTLESALVGGSGDAAHLDSVALTAGDLVIGDEEPVPGTAYKIPMIGGCVAEALAHCVGGVS